MSSNYDLLTNKKDFWRYLDIIIKVIHPFCEQRLLTWRMKKRHLVILIVGCIIHGNSYGGKEPYSYCFILKREFSYFLLNYKKVFAYFLILMDIMFFTTQKIFSKSFTHIQTSKVSIIDSRIIKVPASIFDDLLFYNHRCIYLSS